MFRAIRTVLSAFFGVASRAQQESDAVELNAVTVIITGIISTVLFVIILATAVHMAVYLL